MNQPTTITCERLDVADMTVPLEACYFCHRHDPEWVIRYTSCSHSHLACTRCKERVEQRQQIADEAIPPRPYATRHLCCGSTIFRATWVRL